MGVDHYTYVKVPHAHWEHQSILQKCNPALAYLYYRRQLMMETNSVLVLREELEDLVS